MTVLLSLYRVIVGPSIIDRIIGVNVIGTKTIAVIVLTGYLFERVEFFIDIAFVYALINFIATIAVLKFFEYGDLGHERRDEAVLD
ncbi:MAG TPA: pH regulation protein F [Gemmatimonadetes bacterium]|nr:pH regulation protein F [Gemmatimonadota bacterium]